MGYHETCALTNSRIASGDKTILVLLTHNDVAVNFNGVNVASPCSLLIEGSYCEDSFFIPDDNHFNDMTLDILMGMIRNKTITGHNGDDISNEINSFDSFFEYLSYGGIPSLYFNHKSETNSFSSAKTPSEPFGHMTNFDKTSPAPIGFMMMHKFAVEEAIQVLEDSSEYEVRRFKSEVIKKNVLDLIQFFHNHNIAKKEAIPFLKTMENSEKDSMEYRIAEMETLSLERKYNTYYSERSPFGNFGMLSIFDSEDVVNTESFQIIFDHLKDTITDISDENSHELIREIISQFLDFMRLFRSMLILRKQWSPQGHQSQVDNLEYLVSYDQKTIKHLKEKLQKEAADY